MNKKEIISFMRTFAYVNVFSAPFLQRNLGSFITSMASLAFIVWIDRFDNK